MLYGLFIDITNVFSIERMSSTSANTSATFLKEHEMKNFIKCCW